MNSEIRMELENIRQSKKPARIYTSGTLSAGGLAGVYVLNNNFTGMDDSEFAFLGITTSKTFSIGTIIEVTDMSLKLELSRFKKGLISTKETQRRTILIPFGAITGLEY
jgi:hypothetical protein